MGARLARAWRRRRGVGGGEGKVTHVRVIAKATLAVVAAACALGKSTVSADAGEALAVLRRDPVLKQLYLDWVAAGMPRPGLKEVGARLLVLQAKVLVWYARAQALREAGDAADADEIAEASEQARQFIREQLERLKGGSELGTRNPERGTNNR